MSDRLPRWWRYVRDRELRCAQGHALTRQLEIPEHGFIQCSCGRWVFLLAVRGGRCIIAEVELQERDAMRMLATPAAMIQYLQIFPGSTR